MCWSFRSPLFAIHLCRLRFGDHQNIEEEPAEDDGFIECGLSVHKTENLAGRARRLSLVVAPSVGVSGLRSAHFGRRLVDGKVIHNRGVDVVV